MLDLNSSSEPRRELAVARALLTPTWIAALALLVANDHWLKGSGLMPGVLTGKLSDFAGMIVAPVLLASLLGVRSRRALALCHVAVAAVFAGIQLSPAFAGQWSALMGLVGYPWAITCDPTDLIALPFLLVSWKLLVPAMDPSQPVLVPIQRTAVAALSVFGLWSTVATSEDNGIDPDNEWFFDVFGQVYVNNANDFEIALHIRELRDDIRLDCDEVSLDPGRLLSDAAFGEAEHWVLPGRTNVAIEFDTEASCSAAIIAGEGIPATIVFIDRTQFAPQWFPGQTFDPATLGAAGLAVSFGDDGASWSGGDMIRFSPTTDTPEQPEACAVSELESRIDWTEAGPAQFVELLEINAGVDGCFELQLQQIRLFGGVIETQGSPYPFYLCAPELAVPWAVGDRFEITEGGDGDGMRNLTLTLLFADTLEPATDNTGAPIRLIRYVRGNDNPLSMQTELDRSAVGVPKTSCPWIVQDGCATVERTTDIAIEDADFLDVGVPLQLISEVGNPTLRTIILAYARQRAVLDPDCIEGAEELEYDIDYAVIAEPVP